MILDVGCGSKPQGNVNCDPFIKDMGHRQGGEILQVYRIKNFVLCDGQQLPFRNCIFEKVFSSHVIEHVKNPYKFLAEIVRVCKIGGCVDLRLPHRFSYGAKYKGHINFFDYKWFANNIQDSFTCVNTRWSPFKFFLSFPNEMQIKIFKGSPRLD